MKANPDKCHLLLSTNQNNLTNINSSAIHNSSSEKLLGITIDTNLKFDIHVNNISKKSLSETKCFYKNFLMSLMNVDKRRYVMKAFISLHFIYCPLVRMFHDQVFNNKINRIHERSLRIVHGDNKSSFEELLRKDKSVKIHNKCIASSC